MLGSWRGHQGPWKYHFQVAKYDLNTVERSWEAEREAEIAQALPNDKHVSEGVFFPELSGPFAYYNHQITLQLNLLLIFCCWTFPECSPNSPQTQPELQLNSAPNSTWTWFELHPELHPELCPELHLNLAYHVFNPPCLHTLVHDPYFELQFSVIVCTQYIWGPKNTKSVCVWYRQSLSICKQWANWLVNLA